MALGYKGKMTDLERRRHDEMVAEHHGELLKKGASPTQTDVHSRTSIGSHTKEHGRLWTTDNGKEIHHQWYGDDGVPTHSPMRKVPVRDDNSEKDSARLAASKTTKNGVTRFGGNGARHF